MQKNITLGEQIHLEPKFWRRVYSNCKGGGPGRRKKRKSSICLAVFLATWEEEDRSSFFFLFSKRAGYPFLYRERIWGGGERI